MTVLAALKVGDECVGNFFFDTKEISNQIGKRSQGFRNFVDVHKEEFQLNNRNVLLSE